MFSAVIRELHALMDALNERLELIEGIIECVIGFPTFFLAVYSTYKLRLLITFPPTTRIVLGASTTAIALMCLLHPFLNVIPAEWFSMEKGRYAQATFVYTLQFIVLICTLLLDTKFALMGYESWLAYRDRSDYEHRDGSQGWMLVSYYVGFAVVVSWAKVVFYVFFTNYPLDTRLHYAFFIEDSMPFVSFQYFVGFVSIAFGMTQIYRIHRFAVRMKYKGRSLTESFQVKQIVTLLNILKPLALSYCIGYAIAVSFHGVGVTMLLRGHTRMYRNLTAAVFTIGGAYNTFALVFMLWYLPALRQLMIRDVVRVCGLHKNRISQSDLQPAIVDRIECPEQHFDHLRDLWNR